MENLKIDKNEFRIRKMNAIDALSFQSFMDFSSLEATEKFFKTILENEEVLIGEKWIPVKEKNREIYYPSGIEEDIYKINQLLNYFKDYLKEVFQKSVASKKEQE